MTFVFQKEYRKLKTLNLYHTMCEF